MPFIHILGGANGAGKTTYYDAAIIDGSIDPSLPYINVDEVASKELGDYSEKNLLKAKVLISERMAILLEAKKSFTIERNLAKSSEYEWLEKLAQKGYELKLDFLSLGDIELNKLRVHNRVAEGGHDVPDHIIEQWSAMGIIYLKAKIFLFSEAKFIDNAGRQHDIVAETSYGKILSMKPGWPEWAKDILYIALRHQQKKGNTLNEPTLPYHSRHRKGRKQ